MKEFFQKKKKFLALLIIVVMLFSVGPFGGIHSAQAQTTTAPGFCSLTIIGGLCGFIIDILFIPFIFTGWVLWFAGQVLNFVMQYTVENMQSNIAGISGINIAWGTIRDLMNLTFIFVLLYTAIGTILDIGGVNWKKSLVSIIIAAILINFSLFFAKVIIDASNIAALTFYRQIVPINAPVGSGLSDSIMAPLGLTTLWNFTAGSTLLQQVGNSFSTAFIVSLGGSAFLLITAMVFFAVSIMFLIRYVTFIFLLILSPVAFMGSIVPRLSSWVKKWWDTLLNQALFAPIFMVMVWVVIVILNSSAFICSGGGSLQGKLADIFNGLTNTGGAVTGCITGSSIGLAINFIIIIAFIIGALVVAKDVASQGSLATSKLVTGALGFGAGAIGFAGRNTIGRGANAIADSERLKQKASEGGMGGMAARLALKTSRGTAASSFDARSGAKIAQNYTGVDIGLGGKAGGPKGGFAGGIKARAEEHEKFAKSLNASGKAKEKLDSEKKNLEENPQIKELEKQEAQLGKEITALTDEFEKGRKKIETELNAEVSSVEKEIEEKKKGLGASSTPQQVTELETKLANLKSTQETRKAARIESELRPISEKISDKGAERGAVKEKLIAKKAERDVALENIDTKLNRKNEYAKTIESSKTERIFYSTAGRDGAAKIRKEKSNKEKLADLAKEVAKEDLAEEEKGKKVKEGGDKPAEGEKEGKDKK